MFSVSTNDFIINFPNGLSLRTYVEVPNSKTVSVLVYDKTSKNCTDEVLHTNKNIVYDVDIGQWYTIVQCVANYTNPIEELQQVFDSLSAEQQAVLKDYLPKDILLKKTSHRDAHSTTMTFIDERNPTSNNAMEDITYQKLLKKIKCMATSTLQQRDESPEAFKEMIRRLIGENFICL